MVSSPHFRPLSTVPRPARAVIVLTSEDIALVLSPAGAVLVLVLVIVFVLVFSSRSSFSYRNSGNDRRPREEDPSTSTSTSASATRHDVLVVCDSPCFPSLAESRFDGAKSRNRARLGGDRPRPQPPGHRTRTQPRRGGTRTRTRHRLRARLQLKVLVLVPEFEQRSSTAGRRSECEYECECDRAGACGDYTIHPIFILGRSGILERDPGSRKTEKQEENIEDHHEGGGTSCEHPRQRPQGRSCWFSRS